MKRLILHVGTMKTGTTAIQAFLKQNGALLEEQGICYPMDFGTFAHANPNRNGNFLMRAAQGRAIPGYKSGHLKKHVPQAIEQFKKHVADFDTVILSEETLWRCGVLYEGYWDALKAIVEACGIEQTDVIVYLRRQDGYAESRWRQWVKGLVDYTQTFEEYCADTKQMKPTDYKLGLDLIAQTFGKDHLTVRVYDRAAFPDHDIVKDFLLAAKIAPDERFDYKVRSKRAKNDSLSEDYTELKRLANMAPSYHKGGSNYYKQPALSAMGAIDGSGSKWHMNSEERAAFMETYREGNAAVAREYLGREDGVLFPEVEPGDPGWSHDPEMLLREAVVFYAEALARERNERKKLEQRVAELEKASNAGPAQLREDAKSVFNHFFGSK